MLMRYLELVNLRKCRISHAQAFARLKTVLSVKGTYCRRTALHCAGTAASLHNEYLILSKEPSIVSLKKSI